MRFVIVTGMSGAGKSAALKMLEDAGYYCADNLPLALVDRFADLLAQSDEYSKAALGLDVRSIREPQQVEELIKVLSDLNYKVEVLYLEADDQTLIRRYKETRRSHPLAAGGRVSDGIATEREILKPLRERADYIFDTSRMLPRELRQEMDNIFLQHKEAHSMYITVLSFGFKHGMPTDADLVFDVRFLPNPYYVDSLRSLTGEDKRVRDYVWQGDSARQFTERWFQLMDFLVPSYIAEGKTQLVIAVGCTGGKHRSVTMAKALHEHLSKNEAYGIRIEHRDIRR